MELAPLALAVCPPFDGVPLGDNGLWRWRCGYAATADSGQPCPDVRFCVAIPQAVQAESPPAARRGDGGVLDAGPILHRVALPPKGNQKAVKGEALPDGGVDVLADDSPDRTSAATLGLPFGVVSALVLEVSRRVPK